jgi:hypothetical protein
MDPLRFPQERRPVLDNLEHEPPHLVSLYSDARNKLGHAGLSHEVDLSPTRSGDVHMRRRMVGGIDHEPIPKRPMDNDHPANLNPYVGFSSSVDA